MKQENRWAWFIQPTLLLFNTGTARAPLKKGALQNLQTFSDRRVFDYRNSKGREAAPITPASLPISV
jgi:hypothetical protein